MTKLSERSNVLIACSSGAGIGTMLAIVFGYFWLFGLLIGGFCSYLIVDFRTVVYYAKDSIPSFVSSVKRSCSSFVKSTNDFYPRNKTFLLFFSIACVIVYSIEYVLFYYGVFDAAELIDNALAFLFGLIGVSEVNFLFSFMGYLFFTPIIFYLSLLACGVVLSLFVIVLFIAVIVLGMILMILLEALDDIISNFKFHYYFYFVLRHSVLFPFYCLACYFILGGSFSDFHYLAVFSLPVLLWSGLFLMVASFLPIVDINLDENMVKTASVDIYKRALRYNLITFYFFDLPNFILFRPVWWLIKKVWTVLSAFLFLILSLLKLIASLLSHLCRFVKIVFVEVHSDKRLFCFVDAFIGGFAGFRFYHHFGHFESRIEAVLVGALAGLLLGFLSYEFVSRKRMVSTTKIKRNRA